MKRIIRIDPAFLPEGLRFSFPGEPEVTFVQGSVRAACNNLLRIESGGRFKLFTQTKDYILIESGKGFVKWARGELPFCAGEILLAEEAGEYELNGKGVFFLIRN